MNKYKEYEEKVNKIKKIYLKFFNGDQLSDFEKEIEHKYLTHKKIKYLNWLSTQVFFLI